jgi:hypothetical protein
MTATYNQSTNAFHEDGRPLEVDISLAFIESKNMTREDLYTNNDYNDAEYTYNYVGSSEIIDTDEIADKVTDTAGTVINVVEGALGE